MLQKIPANLLAGTKQTKTNFRCVTERDDFRSKWKLP